MAPCFQQDCAAVIRTAWGRIAAVRRHTHRREEIGTMPTTASAPSPNSTIGLQQSTLPRRRFGKTEESVPVLGLGTGPAGMGLPDERAIALYHAAIDAGVTYLDTAPAYA